MHHSVDQNKKYYAHQVLEFISTVLFLTAHVCVNSQLRWDNDMQVIVAGD